MKFAQANGLVYFGLLLPTDEYEPIRGFTASTHQTDNHVVSGSVQGRDVTMLQRTVTHNVSLSGKRTQHGHTWLIAAVRHTINNAPSILLLSHEHGRLHEEAIAIHHSLSRHVAIEPRIDAQFLAYAKPAATGDFQELAHPPLYDTILSKPGYDYEFDNRYVYVYGHFEHPDENNLNKLLSTALAIADLYDSDLPDS